VDPACLDSLPQEPDDRRELPRSQRSRLERVGDRYDRFHCRPSGCVAGKASATEEIGFEVGVVATSRTGIVHPFPFRAVSRAPDVGAFGDPRRGGCHERSEGSRTRAA
jgi:hypothetical protein